MNEDGYEIVMPFLPVESKGGAFEDNAYVAGYQMGILDERLRIGLDLTMTLHELNEGQADLLAMRYGHDVERVGVDGSYVTMQFSKNWDKSPQTIYENDWVPDE